MGGLSLHFFLLLNELQKSSPNFSHSLTDKKNIVQHRRASNLSDVLLQKSRARVAVKITTLQSIRQAVRTNYRVLVPPNQSLKLTEPAVDDFAARCGTISQMATSLARIVLMEPAVRRRSLAPIR